MDPYSEFTERLNRLAWSLWGGLGAFVWHSDTSEFAIDPEALIIFTGSASGLDVRVQNEALTWCIESHRLVSVPRLKNLLKDHPAWATERVLSFFATVNSFAGTRWPAARNPRTDLRPARRRKDSDLLTPGKLYLRLRGIFGVGAKAEVIRVLSTEPLREFGVSDVAKDIAFTSRNTADAFATLRLAGLVLRSESGGAVRYRVREPEILKSFVEPLPVRSPRWSFLLRALLSIQWWFQSSEEVPGLAKPVERARVLAGLEADASRAGLPLLHPTLASEDAFNRWALSAVDSVLRD